MKVVNCYKLGDLHFFVLDVWDCLQSDTFLKRILLFYCFSEPTGYCGKSSLIMAVEYLPYDEKHSVI